MSYIYYEVPILDDEGNQFAEFDATVHFSIELENGEPLVCVEQFDVDASQNLINRGNSALNNDYKSTIVKNFSSRDDDVCMRTLFLRGKEALELNTAFINAALNADDTIVYHGRGAHDPCGHYAKGDKHGHDEKYDIHEYCIGDALYSHSIRVR